jgi:hypothetical protein
MWKRQQFLHCGEAKGCQIFRDTMYQNGGNTYQMTTKLPNGRSIFQMALHKQYQHFPFRAPQKFTQNGTFWFKNVYAIWQPWRCCTYLAVCSCIFMQPAGLLTRQMIFMLYGTFRHK